MSILAPFFPPAADRLAPIGGCLDMKQLGLFFSFTNII
jgi:hypothetical protein